MLDKIAAITFGAQYFGTLWNLFIVTNCQIIADGAIQGCYQANRFRNKYKSFFVSSDWKPLQLHSSLD